ncbi:hypothetical protein GA0111570_102154 [Raineyella antarctica]|uniref:Winged helix-turn-helix DNA-binding n=1 Tax=Raineyella antarctica TaxID=1577474 RepID=A0A1G6GEH4_9ACTN|nr:hypothetical protein GA0111570_102154 [Raineyella antarctica]
MIEQIELALHELGLATTWVSLAAERAHDNGTDGKLRVRWDGGEHEFPVELKHHVRAAAVELAGPPPPGAILVTEHVSAKLAERLERAGWQGYADASGNLSLSAPGLLIRVTGHPPRIKPPSPTLPFTRTGLPVTFAILVADARNTDLTQRELAQLTGSSLGTVNRVLQALRTSGHTGTDGPLRRPDQLRDQWTAAYVAVQPAVWPDETYSSPRWGAVTDLLEADLPDGALIGSELAAFRHGASIRPTTALVHCPPAARKELITAGRLRRDPQGPIRVRSAFWRPELVVGARTAPPFLVRADLLLADDPRLTEIARDRGMTWNDWT